MSLSPELAPLLADRTASYSSSDSVECQSKFTLESRVVRLFLRRRFWWFCLVGVAAIITLQLSFLPRTSLNRDFRRWHDLHLTRTDVRRLYLVELRINRPDSDGCTIEQHVDTYLRQLTAINAKYASGLAASETPDLTTYTEQQMRQLGYRTNKYNYPLVQGLRLPRRLSLHLLDSKSGRLLYKTPLEELETSTPSYFTFGKNGTVRSAFIYANDGLPEDYSLLMENNISPQNKIVIFSHTLASEFSLTDKILYAESLGCLAVIVRGDGAKEHAISRDFKPTTPPEERFRLPVSFSLAQPILEAMGEPRTPFAEWKHLPVCFDNSLELELTTEFDPWPLNATNIVASLEGVLNDGEIIIGTSRDAFTSLNPLSGHAVMFETMRRFQNLRKLGWRPLRTIRFVSWDSARSGDLGALASVNDPRMFQTNLPILAYVNLDDDLVTGSHFDVAANPLFNHLIKEISRLVPFAKNSTYFKRLLKDDEDEMSAIGKFYDQKVSDDNNNDDSDNNEDDDGDDEDEGVTSLYHYWHLQDNATINNKLGNVMAGKDTSIFEIVKSYPILNLKFGQSPSHNDSVFVPESNYYSYKWLTNDIDKSLELHGLLVRFLGLFVLSLEEHEVVDTKAQPYFKQVKNFFEEFEIDKHKIIREWNDSVVDESLFSKSLFSKSAIYTDIMAKIKDPDYKVTMGAMFNQTDIILDQLVEQACVFDLYNKGVEDLLTTDYPWYKMLKKVHIYAKFKVANYKILRLEKELNLVGQDEDSKVYHHFMYEVSKGFISSGEKIKRGAFLSLYEAADVQDEREMARLVVERYESLKAVLRKMT
ncbi:CIC11C00000001735 [Sungouiella intermedia]|uniref:CIC11C00000001735 n=1 Tax=Sungouiella intermedia TaxID=45354 RepID=A0A1L0BCN8_9ASCO|nr:CIC11C00000001735 [[Candida] intermedia]